MTFTWTPDECVARILAYIGEDPTREGLRDTPARVCKSWVTLFSGYGQDPAEVMKTFEDGACDEMVVMRDITFTSFCEHHMLPFQGVAHIGYLPAKRVLGVSKMVRLLEIFARRLQIQERIGTQVVDALVQHLEPIGAGCVLEATHQCMVCRGVQKAGATMVTSALRGKFLDAGVKDEFMRWCRR